MKPIEYLFFPEEHERWPAWRLTSDTGSSVTILSLGATVLDVKIPDGDGNLNDVVLGFEQLSNYQNNEPKLGCVIGPFANRINQGQFELNGEEIQLECNSDGHHLHGGANGLHRQLWSLERAHQLNDRITLELYCHLDEKVSGYPASYDIYLNYTWTNHCELIIEYRATANRDSIINLTQHSYFNLAGVEAIGSIIDHQLWINADKVCDLNEAMIPTGKYLSVANTKLDFSSPKPLSRQWDLEDMLLNRAQGLDHNWVIKNPTNSVDLVATLYEPNSQRHLKVHSDQPGLQVYSGNFLDREKGKYQQRYTAHTGLCLETQHYPDSPNHLDFPNTTLREDEEFNSTTIYSFGTGRP